MCMMSIETLGLANFVLFAQDIVIYISYKYCLFFIIIYYLKL